MQWVGPLSFALCPSVGILPDTSKGSVGVSSIAWSMAACCFGGIEYDGGHLTTSITTLTRSKRRMSDSFWENLA